MEFIYFYAESVYKISVILAFGIGLLYLPVWAKGFRLGLKKDLFECLECGNCCRFKFIEIDEEDKTRFSDAGYSDFTSENGKCMKRIAGRCLFNKDDKCTAYEARSKVCRNFPFFKVYGVWMCQRVGFCPGIDELEKKL